MVDIIKKKLIPTVVIFVLVLSSFCLPVFAEGDENLISGNLSTWTVDSSGGLNTSITYYSSDNRSRVRIESGIAGQSTSYYTIPSLVYNHSFTLSFDIIGNFSNVNLVIYLQNGSDTSSRYTLSTIISNLSNNTSYSFDFIPSAVLNNISSLRLYLEFDCIRSTTAYLNFYNLSLVDITGSSSDGLRAAITNYIQPSINWGYSQVSKFFEVIESQWYYLFIWYVVNSALIIWIVGHSVFEWIDIFHEGMLSWGIHKYSDNKKQAQFDKIRALRVQEAQNRYELRRQKITEDWEVRNYMSKQKGFITFAEAKEKVIELKKNRDKNSGSDDK